MHLPTKALSLAFILWIYSNWAAAQTSAPTLTPRIPLAPTTAALERFVTMPVSEHTGLPEVSIPLLTVQGRTLTVPVALRYHAAGIRVTDDASWVGLGWSLDAGGVITRTLNGLPDEQPLTGFLALRNEVPRTETIDELRDRELLHQVAMGRYYDFEPDVFSYYCPEASGRFAFGNDGVPHLTSYAPVKIRVKWEGKDTLEVTTASGSLYQFTEKESTHIDQINQNSPEHTSSWYLTRILSADRSDTITFEYQSHTVSLSPTITQSGMMTLESTQGGVGFPVYNSATTQVFTKAVKLRRIRFATGEIDFETDTANGGHREDLFTDLRLQTIIEYARDPTGPNGLRERRRFQLGHSYFKGAGTTASDKHTWRLRLDSVVEAGHNVRKPPHTFQYSGIALPARNSFARDHWGFYNGRLGPNGQNMSTTLIPRKECVTALGRRTVGDADRNLDTAYTQAAILRRITYPTGGYTEFDFEANRIHGLRRVPRPFMSEGLFLDGGDGSGAAQQSRQFSLTTPNIKAKVSLGVRVLDTGGASSSIHSTGTATLRDVTTGTAVVVLQQQGVGYREDTVQLEQSHTYELRVSIGNVYMGADANIIWEDATQPVSYVPEQVISGGLRIRQIRTFASATAPPLVKRYVYTDPQDPTKSSGYMIGLPIVYDYKELMHQGVWFETTGFPPTCVTQEEGTQIVVNSTPIGQLNGGSQPVAYAAVTVYETPTNGKTVTRYSAAPDGGGNSKPFVPVNDYGWLRGQVLDRSIFSSSSGVEELLERTQNVYTMDPAHHLGEIVGFKATSDMQYMGCEFPETPYAYQGRYAFSNTSLIFGWQHLDSTIVTRYAPTGTVLFRQVTANTYNNPEHAQPTSVLTTGSNGDVWRTVNRYPLDYSATVPAADADARALQRLRDRHVVTALVEQQNWLDRAGSSYLIGGTLTRYRDTHPYEALRLAIASPLATTSFQPATVSGGHLTWDPHYSPAATVERYDRWGHPVQIQLNRGPRIAYVWDDAGNQMQAQAQSTTYLQTAYTSFEPRSHGRWHYADANQQLGGVTGQGCYRSTTSGTITLDSLPVGTYELSCWATSTPLIGGTATNTSLESSGAGTNGFRWYRGQIQVTAGIKTVSIGGGTTGTPLLLDELRLHPMEAQMKTFTYDIHQRINAQNSAAGFRSTYEYDGLSRLIRTRDSNGRIMAEREYQYYRP